MRERLWGLLMLVALLLGCGGRAMAPSPASYGPHRDESAGAPMTVSEDADGEMEPMEGAPVPMDMMAQAPGGKDAPAPAPAPHGQPPKPEPTQHDGSTGPLLIYTAGYTLAVYEVTASIDKVQALAKELGGYLVRRDDRAITIRVPAAKYRDALGDVQKLGDVLHREETVEDVTEQFLDMKVRLDNARAMRTRLEELLAAAKNVDEALSVEKELARVTEVIERMEGKLKRLRELINFSTITVSFQPHGGESVASKVQLPFPWLDELGLGPLLQLR